MKYNRAIALLQKYLLGKTSSAEEKKVDAWYDSVDDAQFVGKQEKERIREALYQKTVAGLKLPGKVVLLPFYRRSGFRVAAMVIVVACGALFLLLKTNVGKQQPAGNISVNNKNDIAPPTDSRAVLKLADGTVIQLDSTGNGTLATQGSVQVIKQADGMIVYKGQAQDEVSFNTLSVPRGSKPLRLLLADGTAVWLNVASSITYPTAFTGSERKVVITGEAYFEVAKNIDRPFIVKKANDDFQVAVLGTHFNINTYDDEALTKVTLLEGAVDVARGNSHQLLAPGQQAQVTASGISLSHNADLEQVMAWKNGQFYFDGVDIKVIMRQIEKWYDVKVVYQSPINYSFVAKISRDVKASELLKILELTELVHCSIEGNTITVSK